MNPFHWLFDKFYPLIRFVYETVQGQAWFDQMTSRIWMGGAPTYQRDYDFLLKAKIKAILDLRAERVGDTDFYSENQISYLRLPVLDVTVPGDDELDQGVEFIRRHELNEDNVLIHCAKGRGRSATLVAAYLMKYEGYSYDDARDFMKSKRSLVNLQGRHQRALEQWMSNQGSPADVISDPNSQRQSEVEQNIEYGEE